jgi:S-adenosylmethionine hydrolase
LNQNPVIKAVELTNPNYWRTPTPSTTFHGRDIFVTAGAHLASGVPFKQLGEVIDPKTLVQLTIPERTLTVDGIEGCIQYIDHFGNLITNIPAIDVQGKTWSVAVGDQVILSSQTYSDLPLGDIVALIGSHGWVEIAVNGGSARSQLQLDWGDRVQVVLT